MNKIFTQSIQQRKQEIKNRYLAGDSVPKIAAYYGVSPRDIYYHLGKLTADEKGHHARNSSLKMTKRKEGHAKAETVSKGTGKEVAGSLADFN